MELVFREGFPKRYGKFPGLTARYVFEVKLEDGTTCNAVVRNNQDGTLYWERVVGVNPAGTISQGVVAWRETYNCDAAIQDIDIYVRHPVGIVSKDILSDVFIRHIDRESCTECREYYESRIKSS